MARAIRIPYGKGHLTFTPPKGVRVDLLESKKIRGIKNPAKALREALARPLCGTSLPEISRGKKSACIVTSDITRPVPNALILSEVLPVLELSGIPRSKTTILVGTGTHRPASPAEIKTLVGREIAARYRVVNHDCRRGNVKAGALRDSLTGSRIALQVDRVYVEADLKIVTGLVEPHIFCGYSGGRKAILPGISGLSSIRKWHGPEIVAHPKSTPGVVQGNVAHGLTVRAAHIVGADFAVNVTLNRERDVTGVFAGGIEAVFAAAVKFVEGYVVTQPVECAKVVVTSGAGFPLDRTFYQAIKGLVAVLPVLAEDSIVVLAAKMDEGLGDALFSSLVRGTKDVIRWSKSIKSGRKWQVGQWQWQRMGWTRAKARVFLVSELSQADARAGFTEPLADLQTAVDEAVRQTGADRMIVVPEGPYVVTRAIHPS